MVIDQIIHEGTIIKKNDGSFLNFTEKNKNNADKQIRKPPTPDLFASDKNSIINLLSIRQPPIIFLS